MGAGQRVTRGGVGGLAEEELVGALDQVGHQPGLPRTPRRRPGGAAVRLGQRGQEVKGDPITGGAGDSGDGGRVVEVAPGRRVREQEVVAHEVDEDRDVFGREAHAGGDALDDLHAHRRVVAREPLADVVEQRADEQEVRAFDPIGQAGGIGGGFEQVPVDGVRVVGVALRFVAHGGPLRDESHQEAVLVERLDLVDGGVTEGEQGDEGPAGLRRPGVARIGHDVGQTVQGGLGDGPVELGGGGGEAEGQRRVLGDRRQRREGHLAVDQDHVGPELGALARERARGAGPGGSDDGAGAWGPRAGVAATRRR